MQSLSCSTVTTTTKVSVYAANRAAAQLSFSTLSATIALPTPSSATFLPPLPPLPSQTREVLPNATSTVRGPTNTSVTSPTPPQCTGNAGQAVVDEGSYTLMFALMVAVMMGMVGLGPNMVL
ncbi:uncharacterized protein BDR25DRAFT_306718 [Lindgomyces ingoldianus]|uniref:Uncharacterized protein n=1 Tax=Lindgomyces ingoldianus TaxID=673940 RepID=A0ACB6QFA2_9PLEO|nr:uncharacterized protein BDR25DRAFT_306718 [Lindgomyces ingoldianus]KAF2465658.1 hypothetical protein BDR25DRAFT_306718 [Lindgomyces ingoldianus]